jgi:hypothetical protein
LQVTQKIVSLYYAIDTQKKVVAHEDAKVKRWQQLARQQPGVVGQGDLDEATQALTLAKAKLAELEAQVPALLGKASGGTDAAATDAAVRRGLEWLVRQHAADPTAHETRTAAALALAALGQAHQATGPTADKIRKALETPITVNFKGDKLSDVLAVLEKKVPDLSFHDRYTDRYKVGVPPVTVSFDKPLPAAAVLQAVEDLFALPGRENKDLNLCFVVRLYGVVAVARGELPPGAVTVEEFLRQKPAEARRTEAPGGQSWNAGMPWNPPDSAEGTVKTIDDHGLLLLALESDAGLLVGHTLDLYRPADKSSPAKHLGTVRIVQLKGKEAIAQPMGRFKEAPKASDKVAGRAEGK